MFSSLKSQGFVVEKVFDGHGSIMVRTPEAASALQEALRQNEDAEDKLNCTETRYSEAKSKWRNTADKIEEDLENDEAATASPGNDTALLRSSSRRASLLPMDELVGRETKIAGIVTNPALNIMACTVEARDRAENVTMKLETEQKMNCDSEYLELAEGMGNKSHVMSDSHTSMMETPLQGAAAADCNPKASPQTQTSPTESSKKDDSRSVPKEVVVSGDAGPRMVGEVHASCVCNIS